MKLNFPSLVHSPIVLLGSAIVVVAAVTAGLTRFVEADLGHQSRLVNVSCRGPVGTGPDCALVGFVIAERSQTVVVRAGGRSAGSAGSPGQQHDVLLRVVNNATGADVGRNQHWRATGNERLEGELKAFAPSDPRHAGCVLTLPPGGYSALVEDRGGGPAIASIEVFVVQD